MKITIFAFALLFLCCRLQAQRCPDPRQEWRRCQSSTCVKTCENPNPLACTFDCRPGCYCKDPYVLDRNTDKCVELSQCKSLCRTNEEYNKCGTCDGTCSIPDPVCLQACTPGCYCKTGYVRQNGACINKSSCPVDN